MPVFIQSLLQSVDLRQNALHLVCSLALNCCIQKTQSKCYLQPMIFPNNYRSQVYHSLDKEETQGLVIFNIHNCESIQ